MCDAFVGALIWTWHALVHIPWLEVIKAAAPVATAVIAFEALQNWRRQDKAKRESEFLDALIEAAHTYLAEISGPITALEMAKIGMVSHAPAGAESGDADIAVQGAIAHIGKYGEQRAKRLFESLAAMQPSIIKLRSLASKGQIFKFHDYVKCLKAVETLTWHSDRMAAFAAMTGSPHWNWDNLEVLQRLKDVIAIDPNEIRQSVQKNNVSLLEFARDAYSRIYG